MKLQQIKKKLDVVSKELRALFPEASPIEMMILLSMMEKLKVLENEMSSFLAALVAEEAQKQIKTNLIKRKGECHGRKSGFSK